MHEAALQPRISPIDCRGSTLSCSAATSTRAPASSCHRCAFFARARAHCTPARPSRSEADRQAELQEADEAANADIGTVLGDDDEDGGNKREAASRLLQHVDERISAVFMVNANGIIQMANKVRRAGSSGGGVRERVCACVWWGTCPRCSRNSHHTTRVAGAVKVLAALRRRRPRLPGAPAARPP